MDSLKESEKYYYESFVKRMECYGTPLNTAKAVASEGVLAYVKALKYIHRLTKDPIYLEHMKDGFNYEFSFKFGYNSPIELPPLSKVGWSSSGGSVTSIANPHIHPMSSNIVDEIMYYLENVEDDYGKKGWMSERFCHSEGLITQKYPDGSLASTWFCLMPWASASVIEGMAGD